MNLCSRHLWLSTLLLTAACTDTSGGGGGKGGGGKGGGGGSAANRVTITSASAYCDELLDAFDDVFVVEATTDGPVDDLVFCFDYGNYDYGCWGPPEQRAGYWYGEIYADDMGSDCDEFGGMIITVEAYGPGGAWDSTELR
jgi:hypothetical protein